MTSCISRLRSTAARFTRDEGGSVTIWCLTWLTGIAVIAGLAIDSTDAWRMKTMLASTADVAALAAAWDVPQDYLKRPWAAGGYQKAENAALQFAARNMSTELNGGFIQRPDLRFGHWHQPTRSFTDGADFPAPDAYTVNAVRVFAGRSEARGNSLPTSLLRLAGFDGWDINTTAIAMLGVPSCLFDGIISRETLFVRANAEVLSEVCLHGQLGVNIRPNGAWANPDALSTGLSPADVVGDWQIGGGQTDLYTGAPVDMSEAQQRNLYPAMVDQVVAIGYSMLAGFEHFRHFSYPASQPASTEPPKVVLLQKTFSTVTGTTAIGPLTDAAPWWRSDDAIEVASLDGFAQLAATLAAMAKPVAGGGNGSGGGQGGGGQGGGNWTPEYHATYTFEQATQKGNSNQFSWPAETTDIALKPAEYFNATTVGAPTADTAPLAEEAIYFADQCHGGKLMLTGTIRNVTIVTNCKIDIAGTAVLENAVLLTTEQGEQAVQISNGARIGAITACQGWGGVRIYSNGDIRAPSSGSTADSQFYGAQLVARDTIHFAAQSDSTKGISMMAGGTIDLAAQARIGALDASQMPPNPAGGCPKSGVGRVFDSFAYMPSLVD